MVRVVSLLLYVGLCLVGRYITVLAHRALYDPDRDEKHLRIREQNFFTRCNAMPTSELVQHQCLCRCSLHHSWFRIVVVWFLDPDIAFLGNFAEVFPVAIYHNCDHRHNNLPARSQLNSLAFSLCTIIWSPGARRYWGRSLLAGH